MPAAAPRAGSAGGRRGVLLGIGAAVLGALAPGCAAWGRRDTSLPTLGGRRPWVIAHRGASGLRPEHTLEGYRLAAEQGADAVEPDIVLTKDGVAIARHEPMLDETTDVAQRFAASRRTTKRLDGRDVTAYFAGDFTLAEIKTLRARQPRAGRPAEWDGRLEVPTLAEVVALVRDEGRRRGRALGLVPEIKHPSFHAEHFGAGAIEARLVAALHPAFGDAPRAPVWIQSFEPAGLRRLRALTGLRLVQLVDAGEPGAPSTRRPWDHVAAGDPRTFDDLLADAGLDDVRRHADALGVSKRSLLRAARGADGRATVDDAGVVARAHARGLAVMAWTMRDDALPAAFADPRDEIAAHLRIGVDAVFTDFPATGVAARALALAAADALQPRP